MMANTFFEKINEQASVFGVLRLFLIAHLILLIMMIFTFPEIQTQIETQPFDLKTFGYSFEDAEFILQRLDTQTRNLYIFPQLLLLDVLYPFFLAMFLGTLTIRVCRGSKQKINWLPYWVLLPFVAMFFDYSENIFILLMITKTISLKTEIVGIASLCTLLKGFFTSLSWVIILTFSLLWGHRVWKKSR